MLVPRVIAALVLVTASPLLAVQRAGAGDLGCDPRSDASLLRDMRESPYTETRASAALCIGDRGVSTPEAIAELVRLAERDAEDRPRYMAIRSLGMLGPDARSALPALLRLVRDPDARIRYEVFFTISCVVDENLPAATAGRVVPVLERALRDKGESIASVALVSLARLGPRGSDALVRALRNSNDSVAAQAASLLATSTPSGTTIRSLVDAVRSDRPLLQREAAIAIATFGRASRDVLQELAGRSNSELTQSAAQAGLRYYETAHGSPVSGRCYSLVYRWISAAPADSELALVSPPRVVEFTPVKSRDRYRVSMQLRPHRVNPQFMFPEGTWTASGDTVRLLWTNGFSGMRGDMVARSDSMSGLLRTFWDFHPSGTDSIRVTGSSAQCSSTSTR